MVEQSGGRLLKNEYDVLIIGAGINGAVTASAYAAQGLKVLIVDKNDFASASSSNSSNLAWGGIKYLESHEYFLVNKLCRSRNHLMRSFPSSVREIRFLTTIQKGFRFHPMFIYIGALVYWLFGRFFTQAPIYLSPKKIEKRDSMIDISTVSGGIEYSDAFLIDNDARFVFNFIRRAVDFGADAENYLSVEKLEKIDGKWSANLRDELSNELINVSATSVINAGGPWVDDVNKLPNVETDHQHLLSKGVHLIIDVEPKEQRVLAFFASDGRLFFVLPMGNKTCIGTTDTPVSNPFSGPEEEDVDFILNNANKLLSLDRKLNHEDIIAYRCGVRPLAVKKGTQSGDWLQLSRKHHIDKNIDKKIASIFGGKLTDCINVGEEAVEVAKEFNLIDKVNAVKWYGEPALEEKNIFLTEAKKYWSESSGIPENIWRRWGDKFHEVLSLSSDERMREVIVPELKMVRAEIYLSKKYEKIKRLDDFFRRRYMISLIVNKNELITRSSTKEIAKILFGVDAERQITMMSSSLGLKC